MMKPHNSTPDDHRKNATAPPPPKKAAPTPAPAPETEDAPAHERPAKKK